MDNYLLCIVVLGLFCLVIIAWSIIKVDLNDSPSEVEFRVGDRVEAFGEQGTVYTITTSAMNVKFDNGHIITFNKCGRLFKWAKYPDVEIL